MPSCPISKAEARAASSAFSLRHLKVINISWTSKLTQKQLHIYNSCLSNIEKSQVMWPKHEITHNLSVSILFKHLKLCVCVISKQRLFWSRRHTTKVKSRGFFFSFFSFLKSRKALTLLNILKNCNKRVEYKRSMLHEEK